MVAKQLLFSCLCFALISNVVGTWTIYTYSIPCGTTELSVNYSVPTQPTFFTLFYCFEEFDAYSRVNNIATTNSNAQTWNSNSLFTTIVYNATGYINFLFKARNTTDTTGACATFSHVVYTVESDFDQFYVQPADRAESATLSKGGKSGTVTWKKTGNALDTYKVYWVETQQSPAGQNWATACSVSAWMNPFTDNEGTVKDNGDNTMTANVNNLDPSTPFTVVVVADRGDNTIAGVYNRIALNGKNSANTLLPSMMMLAAMAVGMMLW